MGRETLVPLHESKVKYGSFEMNPSPLLSRATAINEALKEAGRPERYWSIASGHYHVAEVIGTTDEAREIVQSVRTDAKGKLRPDGRLYQEGRLSRNEFVVFRVDRKILDLLIAKKVLISKANQRDVYRMIYPEWLEASLTAYYNTEVIRKRQIFSPKDRVMLISRPRKIGFSL